MACETPFRDDSEQRLLFKIASCLSAGGAGVTSFNGRDGVVTLTAGDVATVADDLYVNETGDSMTGALSINNGSQVASVPYLSLAQTWNNAAVTFTGLQSNVTNTASNSDSNLFNFQTDGIDRFRFATIGQLFATRQDATNSGVTFFQRKRGNAGGATNAIASDATIGSLTHSGWNGAAYVNGSRISGVADENWTAIANGSRIDLYTTPSGSTSEQISLRLSSTGQAQLLDGTAALPALTFQSDPDSGFYRVGVNTIGFSTAGVSLVSINSLGLGVGIVPTVAIHTSGMIRIESTSGQIGFYDTGAGTSRNWALKFSEVAEGDLGFFVSAAAGGSPTVSVLHMLRTGNIGIGTTTPSQALTLGAGLSLAFNSGANQRAGDAVLVAGTVTVANTTVTANTRVFLTRKVTGGTIGFAVTYTVIAATSFTITSDNALDTSTYSYLLVEVP